ncbi:DegV family protein [Paenibacillus psychroresistens]|uniref:DegV family protein n=1 Tax=Paenibacillus psychroresistens TaxID=1778678 RepID=A0A6B8RMM2_9BACL|nr:DegV family protein [Paenibacillus psychroresistens]QGQ96932.1 DegV family protein [Paenibacillus psychroresistens]
MGIVRLVTDSTADIPREVCLSLGIEVVPLKVHFGNDTYRDGVSLQAEQFYELLKQSPVMPTTSQPSPVDFLEIYKRLNEEPDVQIISIHISSELSGTYQSAVLAKSLLKEKADITTIDSRTASYGFGGIVVAAAVAAGQGKSKEAILILIQKLMDQSKLYFLVDTLEYLQKGGRIGKVAALLGSLLKIKPILSVEEGEAVSVEKVRGQKAAVQRIIELFKLSEMASSKVNVMIAHSNTPEAAEQLGELVKASFQLTTLSFTTLGPVIGAHVGPGTVAVFMFPVE